METLPPLKKARKLSSAGYVFRKDRENEKTLKTTWRCTRRGCSGRAYTQWCEQEQRMAVHHTQAHLHGPDPNIPDTVEWVESSEVRLSAPISLSQEEPWKRPRVDAATQLSAHAQQDSDSAASTSAASSTLSPSSTATPNRRKRQDEPEVDPIDFDVDLNVHFDVGGHPSTAGFQCMPSASCSGGSLQQTIKGDVFKLSKCEEEEDDDGDGDL